MKTLNHIFAITALTIGALHASSIIDKTAKGAPEIGKIDVIGFAPEGVLLIGDGSKQRVVAIETGDTTAVLGAFEEVKGFGATLAGKLGVKAGEVEVLDMAVNPASNRLYVAVRKQDDKSYLIVRMAPDGEIEHVALDEVEYAYVPLPQEEGVKVSVITDVVWVDDRLIASGRCNEEFASKIFASDGPLTHDQAGQTYSAETYHVSHRKWETKAPMSVMIPYQEDGKYYIVGAFSCTPVVKYPIDDIAPGAKIKGISMIELGSGNRPLDMFSYEKDGEASVLTNTFRFHHERKPYGPSPHLAFRFDERLLGAEGVNEKAIHRTRDAEEAKGRIDIAEPFHGVVQMDRLNQQYAIALRETDGKDLDLVTIMLP